MSFWVLSLMWSAPDSIRRTRIIRPPNPTSFWSGTTSAVRSDVGRHRQPRSSFDRNGYPRRSEDQLLISWTHEALTGVRILLPMDFEANETRPG